MIIWRKCKGGVDYQVRRAGHSLRLYRDGVFHSQYNGARILNGGVWDALWLPLLALPRIPLSRALVLGVGGGAALKKIIHYGEPRELHGVDLDAQHLAIARRFFKVDSAAMLHCADARQWLSSYRGGPFTYLVDDLFIDNGGDPCRAIDLLADDARWLQLLLRRLAPRGVLVINTESVGHARAAVHSAQILAPDKCAHGSILSRAGYNNAIVVLTRHCLDKRRLQAVLAHRLGSPAQARQAIDSLRWQAVGRS